MTTNPSALPSRVGQTLSLYPQFRILITGNTGIGKSSLVSKVFNVDLHELDIAHDRAGRADIEHGFTSPTNPRFILHDSQGYEPGNINQWGIAEEFIKSRAKHEHPQERVHAIWLCIETPRTGGRLLQVGDENLINLVLTMKLPLLVIFTKYDLLITEKLKELDRDNAGQLHTPEQRLEMATKRADDDYQQRVKGLHNNPRIAYNRVSKNEKVFGKENCLDSFQNLTKDTRRMLHDVEGELYVSWATAQQVSASQKIETSISEGFKKYWLNLGTNVVFEGSLMWDCVSRIHRDILEIWNFYDPDGILTGNDFSAQMVKLTQPIITEADKGENEKGQSKFLGDMSNAVTIAGHIAAGFSEALGLAGITVITVKFLYSKYQRILFIQTLSHDPPRQLTKDMVTSAWKTYEDNDSKHILNLVKVATNGGTIENPEQKVKKIIKEFLHIEPVNNSLAREAKRPDVSSTQDMKSTSSRPENLNMDLTTLQSSSTLVSSPEEISVQGHKEKKPWLRKLFKK